MLQQRGDPIDEGLAADETDVGVGRRARRQMFATAKPDLEPEIVRRAVEQRGRLQRATGGGRGELQFRQQGFEQGAALAAQRPAATPPIQDQAAPGRIRGVVVQAKARFS